MSNIVFLSGVSLGACNTIWVAQALQERNRIVDGILAWQASVWGYGGANQKVPTNVKFAHLARSGNLLNAGLGAQCWTAADPTKTELIEEDTNDLHPGDWNVQVQDAFLHEMLDIRRASPGAPVYCFAMYGMLGRLADPAHFDGFLRRVALEGVHMMNSPYRDFQTQMIVDQIIALPA